ncbi:flavin-dependent monooxygenase QhpG [Metapseudomonas sp. CR1201]
MRTVLVLGTGPAAIVSAILLKRYGHRVIVIGRPRELSVLEGASPRVAEGLKRAGCIDALEVLGPSWARAASWAGEYREINGEHVIERSLFEGSLLDDLERHEIDFFQGTVLGVKSEQQGWSVTFGESIEKSFTLQGDFLVEARGRSAPKTAPDIVAGPTSVALTRSFQSSVKGSRQTCTESFRDGWAWCTRDVDGKASIQLTVSPKSVSDGPEYGLSSIHQEMLENLSTIPSMLGNFWPLGEARARGVQPVLRGGLITEKMIRVGDAAYCNDPLSGHGMYEAVSGAFAAAPVINTILCRPADLDLARTYYFDRAITTFQHRCQAGREHYLSESRWSDSPFWRVRQTWSADLQMSTRAQYSAMLDVRAVVEDGYIVPRRVVVTPEHPRGVRFIAGVELSNLIEHLQVPTPAQDLLSVASRIGVDARCLHLAWEWLRKENLVSSGRM